MKKFLVKLALQRKSAEVKVEFGRTVHKNMNGNPNFTTPFPDLATLQTVTDDLDRAFVARKTGGPLQVAALHTAIAEFDAVMTNLGYYVNSIANGSEEIIKSAGMETRKQKSPVGILTRVERLVAYPLVKVGVIQLRWKRVYGKGSYNVYMKLDGETDDKYKLVGQPTSARLMLEGLKSAQYYWFVIEAVGTKGTGALSDAAKALAF